MHFARRAFALVAPIVIPSILAAQTYPSNKDPRSGLKPGKNDAGVATKNMRLVSNTGKPADFDTTRGLTFLSFGCGRIVCVRSAGALSTSRPRRGRSVARPGAR